MRWAVRKGRERCLPPTLAVPLAGSEAGQQENSKNSQTQVVRGEGPANSCISKAESDWGKGIVIL